jgi:amphi-Trp domain-containing protein
MSRAEKPNAPKPKARPKPGKSLATQKDKTPPALKAPAQIEVKKANLPRVKEQSLPEARPVSAPVAKPVLPPRIRPEDKAAEQEKTPPAQPVPGPARAEKDKAGPGSDKLKIEGRAALAEVLARFATIVEALGSEEAVIASGGDFIRLRPAGEVGYEIKAARKKDKEKVSLELSWGRKPA